MPNLGPEYDLAARLAALEDTVRRMQANPLAQAFSMTQSDGSVGMELGQDPNTGSGRWIVYQGTTTSRDPNTDQHPTLMYLGELVDGSGTLVDSGLILFRPDGSESIVIGNKGVGILDKHGDQIFTTDETDKGVADPSLHLGQPVALGTGLWPNTTSTSLTGVSMLAFPAQQAQITWYGATYLPAGSTGEVQVTVNNGAAGAVKSVGAGFNYVGTETIPLGSGAWSWQEMLVVNGNAAVTSGPGPIYFQIVGVWGSHS